MKKVTKGKAGYLAEKKKKIRIAGTGGICRGCVDPDHWICNYKNKTEYIYGSCNRRLSSGSACAGGVYRDVSL